MKEVMSSGAIGEHHKIKRVVFALVKSHQRAKVLKIRVFLSSPIYRCSLLGSVKPVSQETRTSCGGL